MTLYSDIESACMGLKHSPETVDLNDVRALLRRCQVAVEVVDVMLDGDLHISAADDDSQRWVSVRFPAPLVFFDLFGDAG